MSSNEKKCCDPTKAHRKIIRVGLRPISEKFAEAAKNKGITLIPGKKLCANCRVKFSKTSDNDDSDDEMIDENQHLSEPAETIALEKHDLDVSMAAIGVSPMKLHSLSTGSKLNYAKRKVDELKCKFKSKIARVLKLPENDLEDSSDSSNECTSMAQKAEDLDHLVAAMKEKLKITSRNRDKIQILTMTPRSWSIQKTITEFNVTGYMVRKAHDLAKTTGILSMPEPKEGNKIHSEVIEEVKAFYEDDEFSRLMPGIKDKVSVARNIYRQKRLLLCNLEELYSTFKEKNPNAKIGLSKFCELRPKWCVTVDQKGVHSVCVCVIHQNPALLIAPMKLDKNNLKELTAMLMCEDRKTECMLRLCDECPNSNKLKVFVQTKLEDYADDDQIQFKQWTSTDRSQLQTMILPLSEYITLLNEKLEALIPHSYISKKQSEYIKQRKENIADYEVLCLMDFSENYGFILQDEIQSYHWNHSACTVHPAILYFRERGSLKVSQQSFCFLSDYMKHDVNFVYEVQSRICRYVRDKQPTATTIEYITDGCSAQYKNFKSLTNLCFHEEDFGLIASWTFHATSHGKCACDGIGGSVKRSVTRANLQRPYKDQICTPEEMFKFCELQHTTILFQFINADVVNNLEPMLNQRFSGGKTVPGTRSFHYFQPLSKSEIAAKRISSDKNYSLRYNLFKQQQLPNLQPNTYVCCVYEKKCYVGYIIEVDTDNQDVNIDFMHPCFPFATFYWPGQKNPGREDKCWVPFPNIVCAIETPSLILQEGHALFQLSNNTIKKINSVWPRKN